MLTNTTVPRKIVRSLSNGQITIPIDFRRKLGIDRDTLLAASIEGEQIVLTPMRLEQETLREYTDEDISRFLEEDRISPEVAARVRELIASGEL